MPNKKEMTPEELVKFMDSYMGNDGYYVKPKISNDENSFFMAKGPAASKDVKTSFEAIEGALGDRVEKQAQIFESTQRVECAVCADVPNLMEIAPDNE